MCGDRRVEGCTRLSPLLSFLLGVDFCRHRVGRRFRFGLGWGWKSSFDSLYPQGWLYCDVSPPFEIRENKMNEDLRT
jgi:hypothetical protein